MAQNVSYASGDATLESLVLAILPDMGEFGDGIINTNATSAKLKQLGAYQRIEGGLEAWNGIYKAESSNAKWQGKDDDLSVNTQDPSARMRWDWKIFSNTIVLNKLDKARNRGRAAIRNFLQDLRTQAIETNENKFNSSLWAASVGGDEPDSIPTLISATPTTGTIGGLSRSGSTYLQNGVYSTAITDIGAEAGLAKMIELQALYAVGASMVDIIILGTANWAGLAGYLATLRRFKVDDDLAKIGFKTGIDLGNCTVILENTNVLGGNNTITSNYMYGINSKQFMIKQLIDPDVGENGWSTEFERVGLKLNKFVAYNWFGAFTVKSPRGHFVATSVSTT